MFPTQYTKSDRIISNPGSRIHKIYTAKYDVNGSMFLEETGEENIYEQIQSHKDSVDINVLLKRYQNGDVEALSKAQGIFVDVTSMPKTYAEMLNVLNDSRAAFDALPVETRAKFNHNPIEFMQSAGSDVWFEKLGARKPVIENIPTVEPDVVVPKEVAE